MNNQKVYPKHGLFVLLQYTLRNTSGNDVSYASNAPLLISGKAYPASQYTLTSTIGSEHTVSDSVEYDVPPKFSGASIQASFSVNTSHQTATYQLKI